MDRQYNTTPAFTTADLLRRTGEMQLDFGGQLRESILSGVTESYGLGTAMRELAVSSGDTDPFGSAPARRPDQFPPAEPLPQSPSLSQEEYQQGPFFRKDIPWDARMTEGRAAALAAWYDAKQVRDQRLANTDGWAVKLFGNMLGQALDPINYIPFLGAAAKGAAVTRLGVIGGHIATASADAAINTAIFGALTANERRNFGDDVSFQSLLLDTASAAAIGAVFGSLGGIGEARGIRQRGMALREVTETHAALNDAVGSLLTEGEVRIRPQTVDGLARIAERENPAIGQVFPPPETATAVGRVLPQNQPALAGFQDAIRQEVLRANPDLEQRYTAAETAAREETALRVRPDDIRQEAPEVADRLQAIDDELARGPSPERRQQLVAERQRAIDELPPTVRQSVEAPRAAEPSTPAQRDFAVVRQEVEAKAQQHLERNRALYSPKLDTRTPPPAAPAPELAVAQQAVGKSIKDAKALAEDFGVDYESGDFPEAEDFAQIEQQGRLSAEDKQAVDDATEIFQRSKTYADALEQAAICGMN